MLCACPLLAADDHHHPDDCSQKLGTVSFTISCATGVQQPFERAVLAGDFSSWISFGQDFGTDM